jgi:transcriptional regulator with XRE-family HTH domain
MIFFKENLKLFRKHNKVSQLKLAQATGLSRTTVTNYESGLSRPDYEKLCRICDFFGVQVDSFIRHPFTKEELESDGASTPLEVAKIMDGKVLMANGAKNYHLPLKDMMASLSSHLTENS